jgi:NTP pyrophosphatase (non-canonical NTP hydrolase)
MTFQGVTDEIVAFRDQREWAQFHTLPSLAAALSIEAAELQEVLLWKSDVEARELVESSGGHSALSDEIADVLIYALLLCHASGIDPEAAIRVKLKKNAEKYPVEKSTGSARKYTEL